MEDIAVTKAIVAWAEANTAALIIKPIKMVDGAVEQAEVATTIVVFKAVLEHMEITHIVNLLWINIKKTLQQAILIKTQPYLVH